MKSTKTFFLKICQLKIFIIYFNLAIHKIFQDFPNINIIINLNTRFLKKFSNQNITFNITYRAYILFFRLNYFTILKKRFLYSFFIEQFSFILYLDFFFTLTLFNSKTIELHFKIYFLI